MDDLRNKCYLQNGIVYFQPYDSDTPVEVGAIADITITDNTINGLYLVENRFDCENEILNAYNTLYPNGKPVVVDINSLRTSVLAKMEAAYENEFYGTFTSTAFDGSTEEIYSCAATDQIKINGEVTIAMLVLQGFSTEQVSWKNVNQPLCVPWNPQNILKLGGDLHKFLTSKSDYWEALQVYINDSNRTVDELNNVTWRMAIPS